MKQRFLILYDYGQGGVWANLLAESREEINARHPELSVVDEPPSWMTPKEQAELETIDIDHAESTWLAVPPRSADG